MKIAHIAPPNYHISRGITGPTVACNNLHDGLLKVGADVTLFGTKNSGMPGNLEYYFPRELANYAPYHNASWNDKSAMMLAHYAHVFRQQKRFDVIQAHLLQFVLFLAPLVDIPVVIKNSNMPSGFYEDAIVRFNAPNLHFVALNKNQKKYFPKEIKNISVINESINTDSIQPNDRKKDYFMYVGRLIERKQFHLAVNACIKAKKKIVVVGEPPLEKMKNDFEYYKKHMNKLSHPLVTYLKKVSHKKVYSLLRNAKALVFPTMENEPFGLVFIEALASGTPVVALKNPLTSEILNSEVSILANNESELKDALGEVEGISTRACRLLAEERYSNKVAAKQYLDLYKKILASKHAK